MDKKRLKWLLKNDKRASSLHTPPPAPKPSKQPPHRISVETALDREEPGVEYDVDLYEMYGIEPTPPIDKRALFNVPRAVFRKKPKNKPATQGSQVETTALQDPEELATLYRLETKTLPSNPNLLPDPRQLIEEAIANDLDFGAFKEEQFDTAKNVIDWCRNPKFLGAKMDLFARQFQVLAHFFCDVCYQCSDLDYIHDAPVEATESECFERFVLLDRGICPQCKRNRTEILQEWQRDYRFPQFNAHLEESALSSLRPVPPNEFVGVWGQRSGKSFMVSTFAWTYILHRYLAVPSLARYFDQPNNAIFEASFVAPTLNQIKKYMWLPFRQAYFDSPWFREVREWTVDEGKRIGTPLYKSEETFIVFFNKRISIQILAANSGTLRGGSRFYASVDELGWTSSSAEMGKAGVRDGREVFQALSNSLRTFRTQAEEFRRVRLRDYDSLDGYMFNISSPSSISDPIMARAIQATTSPRIYYTHHATWEVNPREKEHLICEEFAGDPEKLKRDFYAIPPRASSPFVDDATHLEQLTYREEDIKLFSYKTDVHEDEAGNRYLRPIVDRLKADPHTPRVLAVDNGEVKNSFALVVARYYPEHDGVLFEECVEVAPYEGHSVDLAWCYDHFILPLVKSLNFLKIVYDRWNSAHAIHDLRTNHGMANAAIRYSLKRWKEFEEYRNDLYASKLWFSPAELPYEEVLKQPKLYLRAAYPRAHLQAQILTVEQFRKKVFKPQGGNDDLFRCSVLCHRAIRDSIREFRSKTKRVSYGTTNPEAVGFFSSRSGKRSSSSSGSRRRSGKGSGNRRSFSYGTGTPSVGGGHLSGF